MAGPWEQFQKADTTPRGPWDAFAPPSQVVPGPRAARDIGDAILAGFQTSSGGLIARGKLPDVQLTAESPWYHRLAAGGAGLAGDAPAMLVGAVGGGAAGGAAGGPAAPATAPAGAMIGSFALPMALRDGLIEAYNNDHAASWTGVWEIAKAAMKGGGKGAVIGAATLGAGRVAAPLVAGATPVVRGTAIAGAELTAMTTAAATLEGHMPTWQDFMDNALLLGGVKAAVGIAGGMRRTFAETGKPPAQVLADAKNDPLILKDLEKGVLPEAYKPLALQERVKAALDVDARPEQIKAMLTDPTKPIDITKEPLNTPVRGEYIVDHDTHVGVLRAITEKYGPEIEAQRRGVVSNKQTLSEARDMLSGGKLGPHEVGNAANAAETVARNMLLRSATIDVARAAEALRNVEPGVRDARAELNLLAKIEQLAAFKAEADGIRAAWGRAGQIMREMKRDPAAIPTAEAYLATAQRKGSLREIARLLADMKDPAQLTTFAKEYSKATTMEKVIEGWKAGILSGPLTHVANIMGNVTKWAIDIPESVISATLTAAQRKLAGDPLTMAQYKARALAPLTGLQLGTRDALTVAAAALKHDTTHLEKADMYRPAIEGKVGEVIRTPFRVLQATDALFRVTAERAKAYELAADRAAREGIHLGTAEGKQLIAQYVADPTTGLTAKAAQEALAKIDLAGNEAVFSQRLGPRLERMQLAMAGHWSQFVIPFIRTPANLVSWAVQHTPGLNFLSGRWREDFAAGGEARNKAIARVAIGTGLTVTAFSLAEQGLLTGGGMFDKEERGTKAAAGWQPYSVKIGDTYYSYQRMEPVAKVLGIAADLVEMSKATKDDEDKAKIATMLVLMFGNATVSTTYLSGLSNTINAITDPDRYGGGLLEQYASSAVPKIIGQTVTLADPYKREVDGVFDAVQSQLPFVREKLMPKRDVWGEQVKNERLFAVMPVTASEISHDKVKNEAVRLEFAISGAPKFVVEKGPFNAQDKRIELSIEQKDVFKEVAGKNAMSILSPIVNSPDWEKIPDFAKVAIYRDVIEGARKQGQYAALPPDAAQRQQLREKLIQRILKESQAVNP